MRRTSPRSWPTQCAATWTGSAPIWASCISTSPPPCTRGITEGTSHADTRRHVAPPGVPLFRPGGVRGALEGEPHRRRSRAVDALAPRPGCVMAIMTTRALYEAVKAEGFPLPENCGEVLVVMGVNAVMLLQYDVFITDENLARLGLGFLRMAGRGR